MTPIQTNSDQRQIKFVDERGTVAVESVIAMSALIVIVPAVLLALYASFARVWIEKQTYEASICLASTASASDCETKFRSRTKVALPLGEVAHLSARRSETRAVVQADYRVGGVTIYKAERALTLPLSP